MSTETVNQQIPTGTWSVDPIHSSVGFSITHNGVATFRSGFDRYDATLVGGESPALTGTVDVTSVDIDEPALKGHLMSPEFFDAERFSELRFTSTRLDVDADGRLRLAGALEIHGETHEVEASGRFAEIGGDMGGNPRLALSLEAAIDRRSFGLDWNADLPKGGQVLEWEVAIAVDLELIAKEA